MTREECLKQLGELIAHYMEESRLAQDTEQTAWYQGKITGLQIAQGLVVQIEEVK